ncbi:hypothetical protein GGR54DRAFT_414644 [Hypoxylon sp. NC1633]|nr:hypothetical protein GGR54DRAFT_414644 [Hypoxylon sp. NC1633]
MSNSDQTNTPLRSRDKSCPSKDITNRPNGAANTQNESSNSSSTANSIISQRTQRAGQLDLSSIHWTGEMTARFMRLALKCDLKGLFRSEDAADRKPAWERISRKMEDAYPDRPFTPEEISAKFEVERRRYRQYVKLCHNYNVKIDEKDLAHASPRTWKRFLDKYPGGAWLKTQPLGDEGVYQQVYAKESGLGKYIRRAGEEGDLPDRRGFLPEDSSDDDDDDLRLPPEISTTRKRKELDPDINPEKSDDSNDYSKARTRQKSHPRRPLKRARFSNDEVNIALAIERAVRKLREPDGLDEVKRAFRTVRSDFPDEFTRARLPPVFRNLTVPINATAFNQLNKEEQSLYLKSL